MKKIFICLCYILPEDSARQVLVDIDTFDRICFTMGEIHNVFKGKCDFLLMGDFNNTTRDCFDYVAITADMFLCQNSISLQ